MSVGTSPSAGHVCEFAYSSDHSTCYLSVVSLVVAEPWSDSISMHGREIHTKLSLCPNGCSVGKAIRRLMHSDCSDCAAPTRRAGNNTSGMLDVRCIESQVHNHTMCILSNRCISFASIKVFHAANTQDLVGASARCSMSRTISGTHIK